MILVSGNIRFVPIFEGFLGGASNNSGVIENTDLYVFDATSSAALEIRPKLLYSNI